MTSWREEDIERRAATLADTAIGIWPYFGDAQPESQSDIDIKEKPSTLTFLGRTHNVESWRDVLEETVNVVADVYPERFEEITQSMPRLLSPDVAEFISSRQLKNGMFLNVNLSAKAINRYCRRVLDLAGIDSSDWAVGMD